VSVEPEYETRGRFKLIYFSDLPGADRETCLYIDPVLYESESRGVDIQTSKVAVG